MSCAVTDPYVPSISSVVDSVGKKKQRVFMMHITTNVLTAETTRWMLLLIPESTNGRNSESCPTDFHPHKQVCHDVAYYCPSFFPLSLPFVTFKQSTIKLLHMSCPSHMNYMNDAFYCVFSCWKLCAVPTIVVHCYSIHS